MDKVKFAINKLSVKKCRNLKYLYAVCNNIKSIDVSKKDKEIIYNSQHTGTCKELGVHMLNNSEFYFLYDSGLEHRTDYEGDGTEKPVLVEYTLKNNDFE